MSVAAPPRPTGPAPSGPARAARWRLRPWSLLTAVVCLLGVSLLLYPSAAFWFSQYQDSRIVNDYSQQIEVMDDGSRAEQLAMAHAYNQALTGGAVIDAFERLPLSTGSADDVLSAYDTILNADSSGQIGRLRIAKIDVDLPIYHGTSEAVLAKGIGHLMGTAFPIGGTNTHSVLTGHRGLANAAMLTRLDEIVVGDTFTVEVFGEVLTYQVVSTEVVDPSETKSLYPQAGRDLVTLVTCTPIGVNSHRILVTAERVLPTPVADVQAAGKPSGLPHFPYWSLIYGGTIAVLGIYVWRSGRPRRQRAARTLEEPEDSQD